ncbi:MAG: hypothetical protein AAB733_03375 [Patescibacteria group bacterium]
MPSHLMQKLLSPLSALVLGVFLSIVLFGLHPPMAMGSSDAPMVGCMFTSNQTTMCPLSVRDHLAAWQSIFRAPMIEKNILTFFALVLLAGSLFVLRPALSTSPPLTLFARCRRRLHALAKTFDVVGVALADGILQPKIPCLAPVTVRRFFPNPS